MSVATRVETTDPGSAASDVRPPVLRRRSSTRELKRFSANALWGVVSIIVFVCSVFPVYWMLNTSFKPNSDVISPTPQWWPENFTLRNYITVLFEPARPDRANFPSAFVMSLAVTGLTLLICLVFAFVGAVAVSRFKFRGRRQYIIALLIIQMIPGEALMFTIFGMVDSWRLLNTVIGLTIVYLAGVLPFTIWMLRGFVAGVPADLEEAAMIDGCTRTQAFWKVTFPLLAPGLISTGVFAFIQAWNEFLMALIIMQSPGSYTLPIWLRAFQQATQSTNWAAIMAGSTLLALPVVIFFLFVQGRMTGGLVAGAVKG
ncbi:carbohydrate ABC transporter permease [Paramicrobacterium agarici]|uniref:Carbohydrate ABC transporter membrane protein 2 (CUT1 family) n=1 Tax=Paramicrobacterium agarici TaxID=630514 RepID=A0A2A9E1G4_9MICO|nr:carbohydrate ABC transporter permease [Microbacterium agarici]PFG32052.1 carbohydrate ABC transporter membrane protein 2 (CUT1 family) [Microbacterium agarici]